MGCDVLLFGTMGQVGPIVRDALAAHGLNVALTEFPQNTFRDEPGYRRELLKAIDGLRPGMIIPIGSQRALSRFRKELPQDIVVPVDADRKIELLDSKVMCSRLAGELGIRQPRIYAGTDEITHFPVIFKRDRSFGGSGVYKPGSREALERLMAAEPGSKYLVEEYVEGTDYSVDLFRWGSVLHAGCYKSLGSRGQGPAAMRESVVFPELCEISRRIVEHIDYNGVCGVDFRVNERNEVFFLECNPRFTGGIATQLAAGLDLPYYFIENCYN